MRVPQWWLDVLIVRDERRPDWQRVAALERLCEYVALAHPIVAKDETPAHRQELELIAASLWGRARNQQGLAVPSSKRMPHVDSHWFDQAKAITRLAAMWRACAGNAAADFSFDSSIGTRARWAQTPAEFRTIARYAFRHAVNPGAYRDKHERRQLRETSRSLVPLDLVREDELPIYGSFEDIVIARVMRQQRRRDDQTERIVVLKAYGHTHAEIGASEGMTPGAVATRLSRYRAEMTKPLRNEWSGSVSSYVGGGSGRRIYTGCNCKRCRRPLHPTFFLGRRASETQPVEEQRKAA